MAHFIILTLPPRLVGFVLAAMILTLPVAAEPVAVNRGQGQGLLVSHRGNCYLILPAHVHGRSRTVTLATASPSITGDAAIFRSFDPAYDLSVGLVSPGMDTRCTQSWDSLPDATDTLLDSNNTAQLTRIRASGFEEHIAMSITSRDYDTLTAVPADPNDQIFEGTSGAILSVGGRPVGMAITSSGQGEADFLRIDHIKALIDRLLNASTAPRPETVLSTEASGGASDQADICAKGLAIASVTCSAEPVAPEFACSNLASSGPARFAPDSLPIEISVGLDLAEPAPLRAISITTRAVEDEATPPQTIFAEVSSATGNRPVWRRFGSADMTPFGDLDMDNGAAPYANQVRIVIGSSWDAELPVQIDCLGFD